MPGATIGKIDNEVKAVVTLWIFTSDPLIPVVPAESTFEDKTVPAESTPEDKTVPAESTPEDAESAPEDKTVPAESTPEDKTVPAESTPEDVESAPEDKTLLAFVWLRSSEVLFVVTFSQECTQAGFIEATLFFMQQNNICLWPFLLSVFVYPDG
ncbi:hypothetical protein NDU88_004124 [Pleurodeles waltl]|uniref:Uncharacterized protein n=1 Tax=Pleurodeles waltl TaxID=8319 RepID=A0AAV7L015_PLEWA|nr:hypothetical protein NDU88_004124 [Pleurodeles waltl]